jgi:hypothetical protein
VSQSSSEIKNELIKSLIHLLYENIYYNLYFISSIKEINFNNEKVVENFSINTNTSEILCWTDSNFFLKNLLLKLKKISCEEFYSPVLEIKFNKLL